VLTGDPGTDQQSLTAAGYLGGKIVALKAPAVNTAVEAVIVPADTDTAAGLVPFAVLLNGPGEFAGAIGPSGSKKAPVVRALFQGNVNSESYDAAATFVIGKYIYCGGTTSSNIGLYTDNAHKGTLAGNPAVGIVTHVPSAAEPWLGVASLL
jgi:hypothetical protein